MPSPTRRQFLSLLGTASVGLAGCLSEDNGEFGQIDGEWPVEGANARRTRTVNDGPADPAMVWATEIEEARAVGTPVVADQTKVPSLADTRVYVLADAVSSPARHRYRLHAFDAPTGEEHWRVPLRSDPNSPPAVDSGQIFVSAQRGIEQGRLVAFEDRFGDEEWLYDIDARVTAPPVVASGTVYLPDWEGRVHALGVADGSVRWARPVGSDQESRTLAKPVAVQDDTLFVGSHTGRTGVAAVDAETGETMWTKSTHRVIAGPVVDDRLVVVKGGSVLRAFDTDGTDRWAFNIPGDVPGIPIAVDDQRVYVSTRKRLYAITRSGREAWTYEPDDEDIGPPTVVGNEVVVPVGDGLTALAHADGATRWHTETDGYGSVVVTPSAMFMAASGGRIIGLGTG